MSSPVRLLIVEDNPGDADLLIRSLRRSGLSAETIVSDDLEEIRRLIDSGSLSAVLTDHQLSGFTASDVLTEVTRRKIDLPVIVVSGAVGEDMAASLMREGAANFVRKDNLARLLPTLSGNCARSRPERASNWPTSSGSGASLCCASSSRCPVTSTGNGTSPVGW